MFSCALFALDYGHISQPPNKHRIQPNCTNARRLLFCGCSQYSYHETTQKNINPGKPLLWFIHPLVVVFVFRYNATYLFFYNPLSCGRFVFFVQLYLLFLFCCFFGFAKFDKPGLTVNRNFKSGFAEFCKTCLTNSFKCAQTTIIFLFFQVFFLQLMVLRVVVALSR